MNYWLTTQWPREQREIAQPREWAVWLPSDGREGAGSDLHRGDEVLVYESLTGRARLDPQTREPVRRSRGRAGIIGVIRLSGPLTEQPTARMHEYDDGTQIRWGHRACGSLILEGGFVPRRLVNVVLGYKENYNLHGFGDQKSGLKKLTATQFRSLATAYVAGGGTPRST